MRDRAYLKRGYRRFTPLSENRVAVTNHIYISLVFFRARARAREETSGSRMAHVIYVKRVVLKIMPPGDESPLCAVLVGLFPLSRDGHEDHRSCDC